MAGRPENIGIKAIEVYFPKRVCHVSNAVYFGG